MEYGTKIDMNEISLEKKQLMYSYVLLAPLLILIVVISLFPVVYALVLSFTDRNLLDTSMSFIGLSNFRTLWEDPDFWQSVINTFVYAGSCTVIQLVGGLFTAMLLVRKFKGNFFFRAALTFPYLVPTIVAVLIFQWMLNDVFGIINHLLISVGILENGIGWFDEKRAMFSVVLVSVWRFFPFAIMLFVPALEAIPKEFYEAARVDGASPVQRFFHVTLPQIKEVVFVVIVLRGIWMFNMFDVIWLLTGGGPVGKTQILPIMSYQQVIQEYDIGLGSATSMAGFLFLAVLLGFYMKAGKK
jgi:multiple sugar transport system permease protein